MKNFKLFALVLCLVMLVSSAAMADMTPGTYTGVATGMFDGLTVEVTVSATAIEDIKVTSHNETAPGWPALEKLPLPSLRLSPSPLTPFPAPPAPPRALSRL